jgi:hypothetical protein
MILSRLKQFRYFKSSPNQRISDARCAPYVHGFVLPSRKTKKNPIIYSFLFLIIIIIIIIIIILNLYLIPIFKDGK